MLLVAERAWEESLGRESLGREINKALSLLLIVELDRSTIDRRTDHFDRSMSRSFDDRSRSSNPTDFNRERNCCKIRLD